MELLKLTKDNYHSKEANRDYFSVSQLKGFIECEAKEMAKLNGEWEDDDKEVFLQGEYVHAWSEGDGALERFISEHPEIMASRGKNSGSLKAPFQLCDKIIEILRTDEFVMSMLQGVKEQILTFEMWGVPWKIRVDVLNKDMGFFTDLKAMKNIYERFWANEFKEKVNFILNYHYDWQMAIYAEGLKISLDLAEHLEPFIVAASKNADGYPDKAVINFGVSFIEPTLVNIESEFKRAKEVKEGLKKPIRCEKCAYCRSTKVLKPEDVIFYRDL